MAMESYMKQKYAGKRQTTTPELHNDENLMLERTKKIKKNKTKVALFYFTGLSTSYVSSKKWKILAQ